MTTMYDSETPAAIPPGAEIVAAYVDGQWPDFDQLVALHPDAKHVSITVEGAAGAMVGDLEVPNFHSTTMEQCADNGARWAKSEITAGRRPTLYYSRANAGIVATALSANGVAAADVDFWVADWTGQPHLIAGTVATQYASPGTGSGGNYDLSETNGVWPVVSGGTPGPAPVPEPVPPGPAPAPAPSPQPSGGFMPPTLQTGSFSGAVKNLQRLLNVHSAGLAVDGVFGPATETAVKHFQQVFHLSVDGIVGPATWTALDTFG